MNESGRSKGRDLRKIGAGLAWGLGVGVALGASLDSIGVGIALGAGFGLLFGVRMSRRG